MGTERAVIRPVHTQRGQNLNKQRPVRSSMVTEVNDEWPTPPMTRAQVTELKI